MKALLAALLLATSPFQSKPAALGARLPATHSDHGQLIKAAADVQKKMTQELHSPSTVKVLFDSDESDQIAVFIISAKGVTVVEILVWQDGRWKMASHLTGDRHE
jgi:hypothetical protein